MNKLVSLRNFLILIVLVLLGYICSLKGCLSGSNKNPPVLSEIRFSFKSQPSAQLLDSLKTYFEKEYGYKLDFKDKVGLNKPASNNSQNYSFIQVQRNSTTKQKVDCCATGNCFCVSAVSTSVVKDKPPRMEIYNFFKNSNLPLILKNQIVQISFKIDLYNDI